jgi:hypothetical protein
LLRDINDLDFEIELSGPEGRDARRRELIDELAAAVTNLPDPAELNNLILTCDNDIFLEVLMNNIKNDILNLQSWSRKVSNLKKSTLSRRLTELKSDFNINCDEINLVEEELNRLVDFELAERIKAMKLFEGLNSEKPNSMFLSLAKKSNNSKLSVIRKNDGTVFGSDNERNEFIVSFYESLYKKPENEIASHVNKIEEFLGPDILIPKLCATQN